MFQASKSDQVPSAPKVEDEREDPLIQISQGPSAPVSSAPPTTVDLLADFVPCTSSEVRSEAKDSVAAAVLEPAGSLLDAVTEPQVDEIREEDSAPSSLDSQVRRDSPDDKNGQGSKVDLDAQLASDLGIDGLVLKTAQLKLEDVVVDDLHGKVEESKAEAASVPSEMSNDGTPRSDEETNKDAVGNLVDFTGIDEVNNDALNTSFQEPPATEASANLCDLLVTVEQSQEEVANPEHQQQEGLLKTPDKLGVPEINLIPATPRSGLSLNASNDSESLEESLRDVESPEQEENVVENATEKTVPATSSVPKKETQTSKGHKRCQGIEEGPNSERSSSKTRCFQSNFQIFTY